MSRFWILKSEPKEYSIDLLEEQGTTQWDGIRNYQARNYLREMKQGDIAFFYHSSCKEVGIYGAMTVTSPESSPDPTATDKKSKYYDNRIREGRNPWVSVTVSFLERYKEPLLLDRLQDMPLGKCLLTERGNRLSVIPLTDRQFVMIKRELDVLNEGVQDD